MATTSIASASEQKINYLNLLIAQMRNQNPLEPLDNNQMASQLAQISQLDQLETLNGSFKNVLSTTQMNYATSLIGKTVTYLPKDAEMPVSEKVTGVEQIDGEPAVRVGTSVVQVSKLISINQ